jgi:hypothetical protein
VCVCVCVCVCVRVCVCERKNQQKIKTNHNQQKKSKRKRFPMVGVCDLGRFTCAGALTRLTDVWFQAKSRAAKSRAGPPFLCPQEQPYMREGTPGGMGSRALVEGGNHGEGVERASVEKYSF